MTRQDTHNHSLWRQYLRLLDEGPRDEKDRLEQHHIDQMPLKELNLDSVQPLQRRFFFQKPKVYWSAALAVAAAVILTVIPLAEKEPAFTIKGGVSVNVFAKAQNNVRRLTAEDQARHQDLIRAQIQAPQAGSAFWAIANGQGQIISDPERIVADRIALTPARTVLFPGSFELVGRNEGETLVVLFCARDSRIDSQSLAQLIGLLEADASLPGCHRYSQLLRTR